MCSRSGRSHRFVIDQTGTTVWAGDRWADGLSFGFETDAPTTPEAAVIDGRDRR